MAPFRRLLVHSLPYYHVNVHHALLSSNVRNYSTPMRDKLDVSFDNHIDAFKSKRTSELVRAYVLYQIYSISWVVDNNAMLLKRSQQVFGKTLFALMMKHTFYGQFVGGEDEQKIKPTIRRLASFGVKSILDYSVEEDIEEDEAKKKDVKALTSAANPGKHESELKQFRVDSKCVTDRRQKAHVRTYFYTNEDSCNKNLDQILKSISTAQEFKGTGMMAFKMTALGKPQLLLQISEVIMRARRYMEDISGNKGNVINHKKTIEDLQRYLGDHMDSPDVQVFLKKLTSDKKGIVHLFPWSQILGKDQALSDTFRIPDPKTGQMRRMISQISKEEEQMFRNFLDRVHKIITEGTKADVKCMVDAEQTYFQPAIARITIEMMRIYNTDKLIVLNTHQCYLKDVYDEIVAEIEQAQRQGFYWGAKFVRGAYMDQERARAKSMGYEDPICKDFNATSDNYNKCARMAMSKAVGDMKGRVGFMIASHNEDSVRDVVQAMEKFGIAPDSKVVCFGQLLGMCDHITFPLGQAGYSAYKYVPYGPILEVLPYLSRRASENRGVLKKIKKEKRLLLKEITRRASEGLLFYEPKGNYKPV